MATAYYAMLGDRQVGPMTLEELADLGIRPDTYIWCKGMPDWERADENGDVCRFFRQRLAELRHPSPKSSLPATSAAPDSGTTDTTPQRDDSYDAVPPAFRYYFRKGDVPAPEKADHDPADHDPSVPPPSGLLFFATVVTVLCFFPTGIMAIYCAFNARKAWEESNRSVSKSSNHLYSDQEREHLRATMADYVRKSKMWIGITLCAGLILYAVTFFRP